MAKILNPEWVKLEYELLGYQTYDQKRIAKQLRKNVKKFI